MSIIANRQPSRIARFLFRWGNVTIILVSLFGLFDYNHSPFDFFEFISTGLIYGFMVAVLIAPLTILFASLAIRKLNVNDTEERKEMKKIIWISFGIFLVLIIIGSGGINLTPAMV